MSGYPDQSATFSSKTAAKKWAKVTEAAIIEGRHFSSQKSKQHSLAAAIERYADDHLPALSQSERRNRTRHLDYWKKHLGKMTLAHLCNDAEPIRQAKKRLIRSQTTRGASRSTSTINRYHASLSKLFTCAMKWGWCPSNPMLLVEKGAEPPGRDRYLSEDELERLLEATAASADPYLDIVVKLALTTGGRYAEILGLTWRNVSIERETVTFRDTKNKESRTVPLVEPALAAVVRLYESRRKDSELLFPWSRPDRPKNIRKGWSNALEAAAIEDFKFHDLRHTCASYLAMNGARPSELAAVLGHKTLAMVKRYSHVGEQHTASLLRDMAARRFARAEK
ncbi:MAG: site-specific integrase [Pseudomonadota bacterium]